MKKRNWWLVGGLIFVSGVFLGLALPKNQASKVVVAPVATRQTTKPAANNSQTVATSSQQLSQIMNRAHGRTRGYANQAAAFRDSQWCIIQQDEQDPLNNQRRQTFSFRANVLIVSGAEMQPVSFKVQKISSEQQASDLGAINYLVLTLQNLQDQSVHQVRFTDVYHYEVAISDPDNIFKLNSATDHLFFEKKLTPIFTESANSGVIVD